MRDDFSERTKEILAGRVGYRCSNPECRFHLPRAGGLLMTTAILMSDAV
jgi:hypothetical protein